MELMNLNLRTIALLLFHFTYLRLFNDVTSTAMLGSIDLSSSIVNPHITGWQFTSPEYRTKFPLIITFEFNDVH